MTGRRKPTRAERDKIKKGKGRKGAVTIDFRVFARRCKPGASSLKVSVWCALILIFKPFPLFESKKKVCDVAENKPTENRIKC